MNTLRLSTLSLTLAIAVFVLAHANPSLAAPSCLKNPDHPNCIELDDGDGKILQAKFNLTIATPNPQWISSDTGIYRHSGKDHVQVSTGPSPGFRFDTNTQNISKLSRWMSARWVSMTVTGDSDDIKNYEIDFRFNQTNGLDLGSLEEDESGPVAASLQYFGGNLVAGFDAENNGILGFGALNAPTPTDADDLKCLEDAGMITVTRTDDTQWTLESTRGMACRFAIDANGDRCTGQSVSCADKSEPIPFKFKFIIDQQ